MERKLKKKVMCHEQVSGRAWAQTLILYLCIIMSAE